MGQYYKPISVEKKEYLLAHDYDNGLKLMEHSYLGNNFVNEVVALIQKGGAWYKDQIVWAGDYAEDETGTGTKENLYRIAETKLNPKSKQIDFRFLVNMNTKEFVDVKKIPNGGYDWQIHPLPLLTCEGNGQGGGDYYGDDNNKLVGKWARNRITVNKTRPKKNRGYKEIIFDLKE